MFIERKEEEKKEKHKMKGRAEGQLKMLEGAQKKGKS
jgi:hypothetical protein